MTYLNLQMGCRRIKAVALFCMSMLVAGCGDTRDGDADGRLSDDQSAALQPFDTLRYAGITIRNSPAQPLTPRWTATEAWRYPRSGAAGLRGVIAVDVGPDERVYAMDPTVRIIHVFDPEGREKEVIDLRAAGIPDSVRLKTFVWDRDDNLVIRSHRSYSKLNGSRSVTAVHPASFSPNTPPHETTWERDDLIETKTMLGPTEGDRRLIRLEIFRTSSDFLSVDTLPPLDLQVGLVPGTPLPKPLTNITKFTLNGSVIWFGESHAYRVYRRTLEGDTTLIFTLNAAPETIAPEDKAGIAKDWSRTYDIPPEEVPDHQPILYRIAEAGTDRVVVFPRLAGAPPGTIADVFKQGRFEGRIALPVQLEVLHHQPVFAGEYLFGAVRDESGNVSVVGLRIPDWPPVLVSDDDR